MVETKPPNPGRAPFRARRVAHRTLGQKVRVVDTLTSGELVLAVNQVRVVLPGKAKYFKPLLRCAFCHTEFVSPRSVRSRSALDVGTTQFLCEGCSGPQPHRPLQEPEREAELNASGEPPERDGL